MSSHTGSESPTHRVLAQGLSRRTSSHADTSAPEACFPWKFDTRNGLVTQPVHSCRLLFRNFSQEPAFPQAAHRIASEKFALQFHRTLLFFISRRYISPRNSTKSVPLCNEPPIASSVYVIDSTGCQIPTFSTRAMARNVQTEVG